jgi:8-oxo-dGTP pyrophosphatase MutT (NUDIX family)
MPSGKLQLLVCQQFINNSGRKSKPRQRQQVAAVCFRILTTGIEFLLVRTRRRRWTFPKGGVQAGLTHAQSAAIEAYEEAGVHGRIEETAFARYALRKVRREHEPGETAEVSAHLCEVLRLGSAQEPNRNPTWFSSAKAKRRLAQGRTSESAAELARIMDHALARILRFPRRSGMANDPLSKVKFEASEMDLRRLLAHASVLPAPGGAHGQVLRPAAFRVSAIPGRGKVLQLRPVQISRSV